MHAGLQARAPAHATTSIPQTEADGPSRRPARLQRIWSDPRDRLMSWGRNGRRLARPLSARSTTPVSHRRAEAKTRALRLPLALKSEPLRLRQAAAPSITGGFTADRGPARPVWWSRLCRQQRRASPRPLSLTADVDEGTRDSSQVCRQRTQVCRHADAPLRAHRHAGVGSPGAGPKRPGLAGALTSAPRPAPPGEISAPRPAPPGAPGLARASRSPVDPPDLFCPGLNRGQGWHSRESRFGAARRARAVSRACWRVYSRCASAGTQCCTRPGYLKFLKFNSASRYTINVCCWAQLLQAAITPHHMQSPSVNWTLKPMVLFKFVAVVSCSVNCADNPNWQNSNLLP